MVLRVCSYQYDSHWRKGSTHNLLEISSERIWRMTNSGRVYFLSPNTDFPLFMPGRKEKFLISEEIVAFLGKYTDEPLFISVNLKDRM